jgi:hypothetical protein
MPRRYTSRPRGSTKNVEDKQFIAQTVNYANNDGVVWCVLTNGLTYRVYKTNEPVAMDQKLLFEVHLTEVADGGVAAAKPLQLLSRASLVNGELDLWGERVFTDTRVRKALSQLAADPPRGFLNAIEQAVGRQQCRATGSRRASRTSLTARLKRSAIRLRRMKRPNPSRPVQRRDDKTMRSGRPTRELPAARAVGVRGAALGAATTAPNGAATNRIEAGSSAATACSISSAGLKGLVAQRNPVGELLRLPRSGP